jgi:hypothetical protein
MPLRAERLEILQRKPKEPHRRAEPPTMFRMRGMFELLLQMDERTSRLDQSLKVLRVLGADWAFEPDLFENVVRFIITLLVPALKKRAIIGMIRHPAAVGPGAGGFQRGHELRNPLAFAHAGRNLGAPAMMGKRRPFSLREERLLALRRRSAP